jgi:hypothetical protein
MRLSMWIIANRLHTLEPEVHIKSNAPMELRGARNVVAPNCVHVYESGGDIYIRYGDDYIRLHGIGFNYAFHVVQGIFEFYNDWTDSIQQAAFDMDFQKILDESWFFFGNPLILMDGSNRCLAMSSQYADDEVDPEWEYVSKKRYSSLEFIRKMRRSYSVVDMYSKNRVQFLHKDNVEVYFDTLTMAIYYQDFYCGRLNVLGKERGFNDGDVQVLEYLMQILAPALYMIQNQDTLDMNRGVFHELIQGKKVTAAMLETQMDYLDWKMEDHFQVCVLKLPEEYQDTASKSLICSQIRRSTLNVYLIVSKDTVIVIFNLRYMDQTVLRELVHDLLRKSGTYQMGFSNFSRGLWKLKQYVEQAEAAITYGSLLDPGGSEYFFYNYALYYMIECGDPRDTYCVLHPDVLFLEEMDRKKDTQWIELLKAYFDNDCSLVNTAKALYVHRNTLVYRITKMTELMRYDWDDGYNREYLKQSVTILDFFRKKYGDHFGQSRPEQLQS